MKPSFLHLNATPLAFSGIQSDYQEARIVFLGVPFDGTSTYRPGSRFGPSALREASLNIETYSIRTAVDIENTPIHDLGDVNVIPGGAEKTVARVKDSIAALHSEGKLPLMAGGEHTITYGAVEAFQGRAVVTFDAHGDLRDEYLQQRVSHATVMRRVADITGPENLILVGTRAISREEVAFIRKRHVSCVWGHELQSLGPQAAAARLRDILSSFSSIYVSVDLDVLDPAYAPGVGNPEAEGTSVSGLIDLLMIACELKVVGMDIVELCPPYDSGGTAAQAARIAFELVSRLTRSI